MSVFVPLTWQEKSYARNRERFIYFESSVLSIVVWSIMYNNNDNNNGNFFCGFESAIVNLATWGNLQMLLEIELLKK